VKRAAGLALALALAAPGEAGAAVYDEFEVHGTDIEAPGEAGIDQHINYGVRGRTTPPPQGGPPTNQGVYISTEVAYGVRPWWETAVYVPFALQGGRFDPVGLKLRNLFVAPPGAQQGVSFGMLVEFRYLTPQVSSGAFSGELRPIVQWQAGAWTLVGTFGFSGVTGPQGNTVLAPSARAYRQVTERLTLGLEYYGDLGPVLRPEPLKGQAHQVFVAAEWPLGRGMVNIGLGYGLTQASDRLVARLRFGFPF
jgi:hypothetical protein